MKQREEITSHVLKIIRKSQIAIEYCYRFRDDNPNSHVLWVNGSSAQRFEQAYGEISRRLELRGCEDPKFNKLEIVSDWLNDESHEPWLLLLDNADDDGVFFNAQDTELSQHVKPTPLIRYIPQSPNGSVLVTSRNQNAAFRLTNDAETIVDIPLMDEKNSKLILTQKLAQNQSTDGEIMELVKMLDHLPLAIAQAAAFISMRKPRMTIARYSKLLQENEDVLLKDMGDLRRDPDVPNSVIKTWHISFDQIKKDHPHSAKLFSLMSVLDRQGLPDYLFSNREMDLDFDDDVAPLTQFSLLYSSIDGRSFGMHRLVQIAMKCWLDLHSETQKWRGMALLVLHRCFPFCNGPEDWSKCETLLPHAEAVLKYEYDQTSQCLLQTDVNYNAASYFLDVGKDSMARERFQHTLDIRRRFLNEEHPKVLDSLDALAASLYDNGLYEQAVEMWQRSLPWRLKGEEALSLSLNNMVGLSDALSNLGRFEEAEEMARRVLRTSLELQGKEHASTQKAVIKLARLLLDQGKQEEAEITLRQTISLYPTSDALPSQNLEKFEGLRALAKVFQLQRKYREAEEMSLLALNGFESLLGANHSTTLSAACAYALALYDTGKLEPAEKSVLRAFNGHEQLHGYEHPETLTDLASLAVIQRAQGEFELAEETGLQALKGLEKILGVEHWDTINCKENLAHTYWRQGRDQEAISLLTDALRGYERILPEGPDIAKTKNTIEIWQREAGMVQSASSLEVWTSEASAEEQETDEEWETDEELETDEEQ